MAAGGTDKGFKLVTPNDVVECYNGDDVTLCCHLSPETSAVAMEIRWLRETDCIYLYKNDHVTEGRGYEGRVSVDPQELQRGDVSLTLRGFRRGDDGGVYTCQVISGGHMEEGRVTLRNRSAVRSAGLTAVAAVAAVGAVAAAVGPFVSLIPGGATLAAAAAVGAAVAAAVAPEAAVERMAAVGFPPFRRRNSKEEPPQMGDKDAERKREGGEETEGGKREGEEETQGGKREGEEETEDGKREKR